MGKITLKDADIQLDTGTAVLGSALDLSGYSTSVTIDIGKDEVENTAFSSTTHTYQADGLMTLAISIDIQADYADNSIDEQIWSLFTSDTGIVVEIKPTSDAVGASNPKYSGTYSLQSYTPVGGSVGDLATHGTLNLVPTTGGLTRAVA